MENTKKSVSITIYILHFITCMLVFLLFFSFLFIYHGPFVKLKNEIVAMSMGTTRNKFFATWFLSKNEIDSILAKTNSVVQNDKQDLNNIKIPDKINEQSATGQNGKNQSSTDTQTKEIAGITVIDITGTNYKGKLIEVSDPSKVSIGLAPKLGDLGAVLSKIVKSYGAVGGINAGGFQDDSIVGGGTGGKPSGIVIENGEIKFQQKGLTAFDIIGFNKDNVLIISNSMNLDKINNSNLRCAISFGPALILNGNPLVKQGGTYLAPRSAIAQKKDGTVLLLVIDGRQLYSKGANYLDVQNILLSYGAYNAANLDGGGSSTLNYEGKTINKPSDITGERAIPTAFLIMP
jgi:exopolysaccharide biosynthesis protein